MNEFVDLKRFTDFQKIRPNPKEIPIGNVAYYVDRLGPQWKVRFGIVSEHYSREVFLDLLDFIDDRTINGIPAAEFKTPTRWMKLPKGWNYDTRLIEYGTNVEMERKFSGIKVDITNPDSILSAYNAGLLVKVSDKDYAHFYDEIDNQKGYRIVRKYEEYHKSYISLDYWMIYKTYTEAQQIVDKNTKALNQIANLSDYEWAVKEIDRILDFHYRNHESQEEKMRVREWLLSRDSVEDIEVRSSAGGIEWKFFDRKRWSHIEL